jgi:hypothetical protein
MLFEQVKITREAHLQSPWANTWKVRSGFRRKEVQFRAITAIVDGWIENSGSSATAGKFSTVANADKRKRINTS